MVEFDPELHEDKAQCDICEEWFDPDKTVMVDAKLHILNCVTCVTKSTEHTTVLKEDTEEDTLTGGRGGFYLSVLLRA